MKNIISLLLSVFLTVQATAQSFTTTQKQEMDAPNFLPNGGCENGYYKWNPYVDAAGTSPVDGVGGLPSLGFTVSQTSPLAGKSSCIITHSLNLQGQGVSMPFTIDSSAKGKVITITGTYQLTGTYSGGTTSTDSDVTLWVYDIDNGTLIQPTGYKLNGAVAGVPYDILATFQASSNATNYRLIFHLGTTSSSSFTLKFDNMYAGYRKGIIAPAMSDWQAYTPTISGYGTVTNVNFLWRRNGANLEVIGTFTTGTLAASLQTFTLPTGLSIGTMPISNTTGQAGPIIGKIGGSGAGTANGFMLTATATSTSTVYAGSNSSGTQITTPANGNVGAIAANNSASVNFSVPIQGWSSNSVGSADSDTRVVAATLRQQNTGTVPASTTKLAFAETKLDTHGAWSTDTYTVQVPGIYRINVTASISPAASTGGTYFGAIYSNGVAQSTSIGVGLPAIGQQYTGAIETQLSLKAGDTIDYRHSQNTGNTVNIVVIHMNITRISGPAQIQPTETVSFRAYKNGNQSGVNPNNTSVKINIDTVTRDTHGSFSTANNRYVIPVSGTYIFTGNIGVVSTNVLASPYSCAFAKNGSVYIFSNRTTPPANQQFGISCTSDAQFYVAGDFVELFLYGSGNNSASTLTAIGASTDTWFSGYRVGN